MQKFTAIDIVTGRAVNNARGRLAQLAVERIRAQGGEATFIAVRLPHGVQADEADAQRALAFIRADRTVTVDIKPAADGMLAALGGALDADNADDAAKRARSTRWLAPREAWWWVPTTRPKR